MNVLKKYTIETLKLNRARTFVTIIGIILSMTLFTAVLEGAYSGKEYLKKCIISSEGAYHVVVKDLDCNQAKALIKDGQVDKSTYLKEIGYANIGSKNIYKPYIRIMAAPKNLSNLVKVKVAQGRMPKNQNEIIVSQSLIDNGDVKVKLNQELTLDVGHRSRDGKPLYSKDEFEEDKETLSNTTTHTYKVVGIMERLSRDIEPLPAPGYSAFIGGKPESITGYKNTTSIVDVPLTIKDPASFSDVIESLKQEHHIKAVATHTDLMCMYGVLGKGNIASTIRSLAIFLMVLISLGSISLIYNSFAISVSERTKQFGILKSIGATKAQIRKSILHEATVLAGIGIPVGILIGCAGIGLTFFLLQDNFAASAVYATDVKISLVLNPWIILISVIACYVTVLISAWIPARRAMKIMPLDAIRQTSDIKINARKIRTSPLRFRLFGFEGMIATKNFKRNRKRYVFTIVSLCFSIILFVATSAFCLYFKGAMETEIRVPCDISYSESYDEAQDMYPVYKALKNAKGVTKAQFAEILGNVRFKSTEGKLTDEYQHYNEMYNETNTDSKDNYLDVVFLDDKSFDALAEKNHLDSEEFYDTKHPIGLLKNNTKTVLNAKAVNIEMFKGGLKDTTLTCQVADGGSVDFNIKTTVNIEDDPVLAFHMIYPLSMKKHVVEFKCDDWISQECSFNTSNHKLTYREMKEIIKEKNGNGNLQDYTEMIETEKMVLEIMEVFMYGFIILMSLITLANIFNTISTNIMLRRKEFAMMKSVGLSQKGFRKMLNFECLIYGFRSLIFGLPLSIGACCLLHMLTSTAFDYGLIIPWKSMIIASCAIFVVVFLSMFYAAQKISSENPIDALKNENM